MMTRMSEVNAGYALETTTSLGPAEAETRIRELLADEGFGVLTEIDVAATIEEKLGLIRAPYKILGACNPGLANRALELDDSIGVLLPCNVVIHVRDGQTVVAAIEPAVMAQLAPGVDEVARDAQERLIRVLDKLDS